MHRDTMIALSNGTKAARYRASLSNSVPSEILALAALRAAPALPDRARAILAASRRRLHELIGDQPGLLDWVHPRAGTTAHLARGSALCHR
jgi:hypothetical protein